MFRGQAVHTIDAKNRVSIPSEFRVEFERRSEKAPILALKGDHLALYPYDDWCAWEAKVLSVAEFDAKADKFAQYVLANASSCPIDGQGRILVPPYLREKAGLQREVVIAGRGHWIALWDRARYESAMSGVHGSYEELSSAVGARRERKEFSLGGTGEG
jgi:MraZ protein